MKCQCEDRGCPHCKGECDDGAVEILYRVGMEDHTGTQFCIDCAQDAFNAGVFTNESEVTA